MNLQLTIRESVGYIPNLGSPEDLCNPQVKGPERYFLNRLRVEGLGRKSQRGSKFLSIFGPVGLQPMNSRFYGEKYVE
jgi:hypothetical protein